MSEILTQAKQLYLEGTPVIQIAKKLDIPRTTLQNHVKKTWKREKELRDWDAFVNDKRGHLTTMSDSSIIIIKRALEALAIRKIAPSVMEAKKATEIFETLDKMLRLDEGKATDIIEEKPANIIDIQKKISLDPFYQGDDAEFKEIENK